MTVDRSSELFSDAFARLPVLAILRGFSPERTVQISRRLWDAGIRLVEVPVQDEAGFRALEATVRAGERSGGLVGAGTVTTIDRLHRARDLGAGFTVAPGFVPEVSRASLAAGLPHLPGVATATEVGVALASGLRWLKMFPASDLGPTWARSMHGPFPEARFVATGGVGIANAEEFLANGAAAVALGSALADPEELEAVPALLARVAPEADAG
jgi:2-dehydro-3-deoxyphosphogluconate aldolase/(4S)-4-hydroxy-2-oxoglutarate aldolase